ncbi:MAG TPA: nitrile hydratase subunit alpha [Geminicoccaceae bacterium]|nr:nitrile hydratase subunit alpha [Geminicoccaceae bacterium]
MTAHAEQRHRHPHPRQPDLEDQPFDHYQLMAEAIGELLIAKGVFGADDLRRTIEAIDARSPADGARLVARAWLDPAFKSRVLEDVNAAAAMLGIDAGAIPIRALENTPRLHNVVVCTLCSCYPRGLLGLPPDWYKARAYRSRTIREPRAVLVEFGTSIADDVEIRVHDSTADLRYLVLPMRPPGTEDMGETELAALVTRDCLIGTAVPRPV